MQEGNFVLALPLEMNKIDEDCNFKIHTSKTHKYLMLQLLTPSGSNKEENYKYIVVQVGINAIIANTVHLWEPRMQCIQSQLSDSNAFWMSFLHRNFWLKNSFEFTNM